MRRRESVSVQEYAIRVAAFVVGRILGTEVRVGEAHAGIQPHASAAEPRLIAEGGRVRITLGVNIHAASVVFVSEPFEPVPHDEPLAEVLAAQR